MSNAHDIGTIPAVFTDLDIANLEVKRWQRMAEAIEVDIDRAKARIAELEKELSAVCATLRGALGKYDKAYEDARKRGGP